MAEHPEVFASTEWIDPTLCVQWLDTNGWDLDSGQIPSFSSTELPSQPPAPFLAANITAPHLHMHPSHPAHDTSAVRPTLVPEPQEPAVIVISDSDDEPRPPPRKVSRERRAPEPEDPAPTSRYGDNPVRLNKQIIADTCKTLDDAPEIWDVPRPGRPAAAYLLDRREKQHDNKFNISGREKLSVDAYIKLQVRASPYHAVNMIAMFCSVKIRGKAAQGQATAGPPSSRSF